MRRIFAISTADTPETISAHSRSIAIIDEKTLETSRVFTFTEALRSTVLGILPRSPRLVQSSLKFRF